MSAPRRPRRRTGNMWPAIVIAVGVNLIAGFADYTTNIEHVLFVVGDITLMSGVVLAIRAGRDGHRDD